MFVPSFTTVLCWIAVAYLFGLYESIFNALNSNQTIELLSDDAKKYVESLQGDETKFVFVHSVEGFVKSTKHELMEAEEFFEYIEAFKTLSGTYIPQPPSPRESSIPPEYVHTQPLNWDSDGESTESN